MFGSISGTVSWFFAIYRELVVVTLVEELFPPKVGLAFALGAVSATDKTNHGHGF